MYPAAPFLAYKLGNGAPFASRARTLGAPYTVAPADAGSDFEASAGITLTLPAASTMTGQTIGFRSNAAGSTLTLASGTLEGGGLQGSTSVSLGVGDWVAVLAGATNWRLLASAPNVASVHGSQTFTASGTFTAVAGATNYRLKAWGAGSGGDGAAGSAVSSGGSGGGYAEKITQLVPGTGYAVTVGTAGTGGSGTGGAGTAGGTSSFAAIISAMGGNRSTPGTGSGGTLNIAGASGVGGFGTPVFLGGVGGGAFGSSGTSNTTSVGLQGVFPGGGGGGSGAYNSNNGGNGANGLVTVEW